MGTIKDLPILDRPREKALRYGINSLSDIELLTLIISKGYQGSSALEISSTLISKFNGLENLSKVSTKELTKVKGIKEAKALNLIAIFEFAKRISIKKAENSDQIEVTSDSLYTKYKYLVDAHQENLILILLNHGKNVSFEKTIYIGTENNMIYSYKDIWREILNHHARYFYLIHNHPAQSSSPSKQDIIFTSELMVEAQRIGVPLIDHIIIGDDGYYSFLKQKKSKTILS